MLQAANLLEINSDNIDTYINSCVAICDTFLHEKIGEDSEVNIDYLTNMVDIESIKLYNVIRTLVSYSDISSNYTVENILDSLLGYDVQDYLSFMVLISPLVNHDTSGARFESYTSNPHHMRILPYYFRRAKVDVELEKSRDYVPNLDEQIYDFFNGELSHEVIKDKLVKFLSNILLQSKKSSHLTLLASASLLMIEGHDYNVTELLSNMDSAMVDNVDGEYMRTDFFKLWSSSSMYTNYQLPSSLSKVKDSILYNERNVKTLKIVAPNIAYIFD